MTSPVSPSETIAKALEGVTPGVWEVKTADEWSAGFDFFAGQDGAFVFCADVEPVDAAYIAACNPVAMREVLDELYALRENALKSEAMQRRAEDAEALAERLKLEAQAHAMEARTANSTINEIYQVVSGGNGEPGNWHGATPVREKLEAMEREMAEKDERIAALEAGMKPFAKQEAHPSWDNGMRISNISPSRLSITVGDLRRARTLIQGEKK